MEIGQYLTLLLVALLRHSPVILIGVIGLRYALPLKHKIRRAANWASVGFSLLIVHAIARVARDVVSAIISLRFEEEPLGTFLTLNGLALLAYLPLLGGLAFLARSFFLDRNDLSSQPQEHVAA
jgi:hypothetical protein